MKPFLILMCCLLLCNCTIVHKKGGYTYEISSVAGGTGIKVSCTPIPSELDIKWTDESFPLSALISQIASITSNSEPQTEEQLKQQAATMQSIANNIPALGTLQGCPPGHNMSNKKVGQDGT